MPGHSVVDVPTLLLVQRGTQPLLGLYHDETTFDVNAIKGSATVSGTLGAPVPAAGNSTGIGNVTGRLVVDLSAVSAGTSTVAGALDLHAGEVTFAVAIIGAATASGALAGAVAATAATTGVATVTGVLTGTANTSATAAGTSTVAGALDLHSTDVTCSATAAGTSTVTGAAAGVVQAASIVAGKATVAGSLGLRTPNLQCAADSAGASTVTGVLTGTANTSATAAGTSTVAGALDIRTANFAAAVAVAGKATVAGVLTGTANTSATVTGASIVTAALTKFGVNIAGGATVTAALEYLDVGLGNVQANGLAAVTGGIAIRLTPAGTSQGTATAVGALQWWGPAAIAGTSTVTAALERIGIVLTGGAAGGSYVYSSLQTLHNRADGVASVIATLTSDIAVAATTGCTSTLAGEATVDGPFEVGAQTTAQVAAAAMKTAFAHAQVSKSAGDVHPIPYPGPRPLPGHEEDTRDFDFV